MVRARPFRGPRADGCAARTARRSCGQAHRAVRSTPWACGTDWYHPWGWQTRVRPSPRGILRPTSPQLCGGTRAAPCGSSPHIVYTEAGGAIGENKGLRLESALVVSAPGVPDGATTRQQPRRDRSAEEIALARRFFRSATRRACRCTRALPRAPRGQIRSNKRP